MHMGVLTPSTCAIGEAFIQKTVAPVTLIIEIHVQRYMDNKGIYVCTSALGMILVKKLQKSHSRTYAQAKDHSYQAKLQ